MGDVRYAFRLLAKNPVFTAVAVLTLALGIGANTAIFSLVDVALLHPLPFPAPSRLVMVWTENPGRDWHHFPASVPDYADWKQSGVFERLGMFTDAGLNMRIGDRTERVASLSFTSEVFEAVEAKPHLGRIFQSEDVQPGHDRVVILGDDLWRSHFAADPRVVGKSVVLDGDPYTILGVMPKGFPKFSQEQLYVPLVFDASVASDRGTRSWGVLGRLRPGISLGAAQQRLAEVEQSLAARYPKEDAGNTVKLQPLGEAAVEDVRPLLLVLAGVVGFVLLIACANVAGLLMARGSGRQKEMAIRAALGASRGRLVRQLLTESVVLAVAGGVLGLVPVVWGVDFITSFAVDGMPSPDQVTINATVLAFSLILSLGTGLLFGTAPAFQAWKAGLNERLKSVSTSQGERPRQRLRSALVVAEIALTLTLLAGAGLMLQTFVRMRAADPGFNSTGVATMTIALASRQYASPEKQRAFFDEVLRRVRALPGVASAGACDALPPSDEVHGAGLHFDDRPDPPPNQIPLVLRDSATPDYFRAMQIPLVRGRYFLDSDKENTPAVALVDEWTARRYWPNQDALGKRIRMEKGTPWREAVGVVGSVKRPVLALMAHAEVAQVYLPFAQTPKPAMSLAARALDDPKSLIPAIRSVVRDVDVDQPVFQERTLSDARAAGMSSERLAALLLGSFAAAALLLAMIGVYGVVAFSVSQRTREIGLRMALGARPGDVLKAVLGQGAVLMTAGLTVGLAGALALTRVMAGMLYGVRPSDPATFGAVSLLLGAAALFASYIPARRAMKVDPTVALRCE